MYQSELLYKVHGGFGLQTNFFDPGRGKFLLVYLTKRAFQPMIPWPLSLLGPFLQLMTLFFPRKSLEKSLFLEFLTLGSVQPTFPGSSATRSRHEPLWGVPMGHLCSNICARQSHQEGKLLRIQSPKKILCSKFWTSTKILSTKIFIFFGLRIFVEVQNF